MRLLSFLLARLAIPAFAASNAGSEMAGDCLHRENEIVINTQEHRLSLCREQKAEREFTVSLGSGGIGKHEEGDHRTPLGSYALGTPRPSEEFVLFIPVGYPTLEQRKAGYTGGDIGIHGPKKQWAWLGRLANWRDWTRGCIAVGRAEDIREIAAWVNRYHPTRVDIIGSTKL